MPSNEIKPMSPQELMEDFRKKYFRPEHPEEFKDCECYSGQEGTHDMLYLDSIEQRDWFRSSLKSVLLYVKESKPKWKDASYKPWSDPKDPVEDLSGVENELRSRRALAYNAGIDAYDEVLTKIIESI